MTKKTVILPEGYKPSDQEEFMNEFQLEYFRQKLEDWKKDLEDQAERTIELLRESTDDTKQALDDVDRASEETNQQLRMRRTDRHTKLIKQINSALRRIETGSYGYCEMTGEPIGLKRLEARPIAKMTIQAQEEHENQERQYKDDRPVM